MYIQYLLDSGAADDANFPTFVIPPTNFAYFKINTITVPLSFHPTGTQNNQIALKEDGGATRYVTLPSGSYNAVTFPTALQTALGGSYVVTYDEIQRNIKITNNDLTFSILDLSGGTTAFAALGRTKYGGASPDSNVFQEGAVDFGGTRSMFLISQDLHSKDVVVGNSASVNALCLIEIDSPGNTVMRWVNNGDYLTLGREMNMLRFQLIDSATLNVINFRNRPFQITMSALTDWDDLENYA